MVNKILMISYLYLQKNHSVKYSTKLINNIKIIYLIEVFFIDWFIHSIRIIEK